ncbi:RIP metalloprotease RseP [Sphingomonas sp. SUN039]|uniref:RIP metalloprotease RseP n=1 Tax=Sphingomonas sp. SUN039 TaxID=2937787 RepID=UPI00216426BC|nr:RIP metalloprotease RseP [Sphingomonas sp. SUN039]UVO53280.1 RIP metalloprotease RseP [Sphingomonas sp. SUN039]
MIETPNFLWAIVFFLIAIFPLVVIHELGHYLVGRWFGVKAEVFSIGFGRRIAGWTDKRGTDWRIGWLPLGGYVRFAGDMTAAGQTDPAWLNLPAEERNKTFQSKPVWQRALIVFAGPAVNFLFAIVMLAGLFGVYGEPRIAPQIGVFTANSAAQAAGMKIGDRILSVDGGEIRRFEDIGLIVQARAEQPTTFVVDRQGTRVVLDITPRRETIKDITGVGIPTGRIGIGPSSIERVKLSPVELPGAATRFIVYSVRTMVVAMGQIATGNRSVKELGGPVKMAATSEKVAQLGFVSFLFFMAMVSINLGFINLLPIPTLDGGHLAFYAVEAVQRKPVGLAAQEWAYRSGLIVLLAFMLFVTINDLAGFGLFGRFAG